MLRAAGGTNAAQVLNIVAPDASARPPVYTDNSALGYSVASVWQYDGRIYKPTAAPDATQAAWEVQQAVGGAFTDIVGTTNTIFAGGLAAMKAGYVGNACDISATVSGGTVTATINILSTGELDVLALQAVMARADAGTSVFVTKLYDQSGAGNHAVKDNGYAAPYIDFDAKLGRYVLTSDNSSTSVTRALRFPMGAVSGNTVSSGFGVSGANYTAMVVGVGINGGGNAGLYAVGDYGGNSAAAYNAGTAYTVDQYVKESSVIYKCIQAGTGNTPSTSPTFWKLCPAQFSTVQVRGSAAVGLSEWNTTNSERAASPKLPQGNQPFVLVLSSGASACNLWYNEATNTSSARSTTAYQSGWIGFNFPLSSGPFFPAKMLGVAIANTAVTSAQSQALRYSAYTRFDIRPQVVDRVFCIGDSRTASSLPATNKAFTWSMALATELGRRAEVYGCGTGSATSAILATTVADVTPLYTAGAKNIVVYFGAVNDFIVSSLTPAQALAAMQTNLLALKTAGFKVVLVNELVTTSAGGAANTNLPILRGLIAAAGTAGMNADAIVTPTNYAPFTDATNTTYFNDGLHPTAAADALLASLVAVPVKSILNGLL